MLASKTVVSGVSLRALHVLTQLHVLSLSNGEVAEDFGDADLAALVRALHRLRSLTQDVIIEDLSEDVLRGVALAGPQLRYIDLSCAYCCFGPIFRRCARSATLSQCQAADPLWVWARE